MQGRAGQGRARHHGNTPHNKTKHKHSTTHNNELAVVVVVVVVVVVFVAFHGLFYCVFSGCVRFAVGSLKKLLLIVGIDDDCDNDTEGDDVVVAFVVI